MRRLHWLCLALMAALALPVLADSINVPPYELSILNVVVQPNGRQTNIAKGLYLKGGYVLTAHHVVETWGNTTHWLSSNETPQLESLDLMDDQALDFSILAIRDVNKGARFTQFFGGFGSTDLQPGDTVYYFKNDSQSEVQNDVIVRKVLANRNAAGRIAIEGGVAQGYSGSPVFSTRTQKLVGMIVFGDTTMTELSPIEDILAKARQTNEKVVSIITGQQ
ncbi:MAG: S1 family peptidase [Candidatus Xenobia bacterium]